MKTELLAPAGSYESMTAAICAGADSVYMGGAKFGARAFAENGDEETIVSAIDYAHLHGRKLYLTVNTLLKEKELERDLFGYLCPFYEAGLDAVIVQDMGVMSFIRKNFPGLHIHASTQMTITGPKGAKLMEEMGCSRIVTARELSLEELSAIRKETDLEIESFVHGALCFCYSGQCLMSSLFGGRSGNRGRCAQPCRLPYEVCQNGRRRNGKDSQYVLSPKDMCTVELLPEIIRAGVNSLKIEGRMKKPEYTAGVVGIYRKYLDKLEENKEAYQVSREDLRELYDLYNRDGFHTGYYKDHNGPAMMASKNEKAKEGQKARNEALFSRLKAEYVDKDKPIGLDGTLTLSCGSPAALQIGAVSATGDLVQQAVKQPLSEERVRTQMLKTGGTPYEFNNLTVRMDESVFIPMQSLNHLRREALNMVTKENLEKYRRTSPAEGKSVYPEDNKKSSNLPVRPRGFCISVETEEQLNAALDYEHAERIYASVILFLNKNTKQRILDFIHAAVKNGQKPYLAMPFVVRDHLPAVLDENLDYFIRQGLSGYLVRNLETLAILKEKNLTEYATIDANLYTYNQEAQQFYRSMGVCRDTAPHELNSRELSGRSNQNSELIIYGYIPLMITAQCIKKNLMNCSKNSEVLTLTDRYKKNFCVKCVCDFCYNIIYNSIPLGLTDTWSQVEKLGFGGLRLSFTTEDREEMEQILRGFTLIYIDGADFSYPSDMFTKGHFKRGVE